MSRELRIKLALAWGVVVVGLIFYFTAALVHQRVNIETSILSLIPELDADPSVRDSLHGISEMAGKKVVFALSSRDESAVADASAALIAALERTKGVVAVDGEDGADSATMKWFFDNRWYLASPRNKELLTQKSYDTITRRALQEIYNPVTPASAMQTDPAFFFADYLATIPVTLDAENAFERQGIHHRMIAATVKVNSFGGTGVTEMVQRIEQRVAHVEAGATAGDLSVAWTGVLKFAGAAQQQAKGEISTIGLGSVLGIILLILVAFRSLRKLLAALLPIVVGLLAAVVVTLLIFGEIHIMTLVFGASLVGVCVDYAFHYFAHAGASRTTDVQVVWRQVIPGITMGMLTSVIGYLALYMIPAGSIQQMAVFASVGLVASYVTVLLWFPLMLQHGSTQQLYGSAWLQQYLVQVKQKRVWLAGMGLLLAILFSFGIFSLEGNDDVRALVNNSPQLMAESDQITSARPGFDKSRFVLVTGKNRAELEAREMTVTKALSTLVSAGYLDRFLSIATFIPPVREQIENARMSKAYLSSDAATVLFKTLGISQSARQRLVESIRVDTPIHDSDIPIDGLKGLRTGTASVVLLGATHDRVRLESVLDNIEGACYFSQVESIEELFRTIRRQASGYLVVAYLVIFGAFVWRYRWKKALVVMSPTLLTSLLLLGTMGFLHIPMNIFSLIAIILILAVGIDYAIFLAESEGHVAPTALAIVLSACTTILSLGLLALSGTPALHVLGLVMVIGIAMALLLAPLATFLDPAAPSEVVVHDESAR